MSRTKELIKILAIIAVAMFVIPLITVYTVKADAGMLVTMILFFAVHPLVSAAVGVLAGRDVKFFWFAPVLVGGLFWIGSSLTYQVAFPAIYSASYFVICAVSMAITCLVIIKRK